MDSKTSTSQKRWFAAILVTAFLLPLAFFGAIKIFLLAGLPLYFSQLGLYAILLLFAFLGLHQERISLNINWKKVVGALIVSALAWLVYALIYCTLAKTPLSVALSPLGATPAWKIFANILSTWIFVGVGEEILFRGYFLTKIKHFFEKRNVKKVTLAAILVSSLLFSVWHLPVRIFELLNGQSSIFLIALSMMILFIMGIAFSWLFIRSGNLLLVGLVHGLNDFPLIGKESQLSFIVILVAIVLVELFNFMNRKSVNTPDPEDF